MANRYIQTGDYDVDDDGVDLLPAPYRDPSYWQEKSPTRQRNLLYITASLLLVVGGILLYMFRYKLFLGLGNVPVGLWSRDGILTVGSKTPFHIKVCTRPMRERDQRIILFSGSSMSLTLRTGRMHFVLTFCACCRAYRGMD
jgi:hypothetical protein